MGKGWVRRSERGGTNDNGYLSEKMGRDGKGIGKGTGRYGEVMGKETGW